MEAVLPRYYFHLYNDEILRDDVGEEFSDDEAAREAAVRGASELIAEHIAEGRAVDLRHRMEVEDDAGRVTAVIRFGSLFKGYRELKAENEQA